MLVVKRHGDVAGSVCQSSREQLTLKNNPNLLQPSAPTVAVRRDVGCSADALLTPEQFSVRAKISLV